jgi:hypothetical protein
MTPVLLQSPDGRQQVTVNVEGITPAQYQQVSDQLGVELDRRTQTYVGVANTMRLALLLCPYASVSSH